MRGATNKDTAWVDTVPQTVFIETLKGLGHLKLVWLQEQSSYC